MTRLLPVLAVAVALLAPGSADAGYILEQKTGNGMYTTIGSAGGTTGSDQTLTADFLITVTWGATSIDLQVQTLGNTLGDAEFLRATLTDIAAGTYTGQGVYTGPAGATRAESWVNTGNAPGAPTANTTGVLSTGSGFVSFATSPFTMGGLFAVSTEVRFPTGAYGVDTYDSQAVLTPQVAPVPAPAGLVLAAAAVPFLGLVRRKRAA